MCSNICIIYFLHREVLQRMSNLSSIGRKSQSLPSEHHHWEGACILQLDYNVVLISGKTAFLSIRSEQVLFLPNPTTGVLMFLQGYLNIPLPTPLVPRRGAGCVLLPDFRILVAGNPDCAVCSLHIHSLVQYCGFVYQNL